MQNLLAVCRRNASVIGSSLHRSFTARSLSRTLPRIITLRSKESACAFSTQINRTSAKPKLAEHDLNTLDREALLRFIISQDAPTSDSGSSGEAPSSGTGPTQASPIDVKPESEQPQSTESVDGESKNEPELTPSQIVGELDRFIVGQIQAKKSVAIAMRNRWRRHRLPPNLVREVIPKNILMIGPTGVGKTEIARRLAKLTNAPFVKVEATKYTEVGFHGKDVDMMIRELVEVAILNVKASRKKKMKQKIDQAVEEALLRSILGKNGAETESFRPMLRAGALESVHVEIDVPIKEAESGNPNDMMLLNVKRVFGLRRTEKRKMTVAEARPILEEIETEKLSSNEDVVKEAIKIAESDGIVFIDEIDKICARPGDRYSADASAEGVQRDLLPLIEGSTINTKYGNVETDHILFIASGAFHAVKPSDLLPELQGRLPIRVELKALTEQDLYRILTEPEQNLIIQQKALMKTEGVELEFTDDAVKEIARVAAEVNRTLENIGARRLHTVVERIMEDISFDGPTLKGQKIVVDVSKVKEKVSHLQQKTDLSRYVL